MRLDLSVNDLEQMTRGLNTFAIAQEAKLAEFRRKKSGSAEDIDYAKHVAEETARARATESKVLGAVDAAKRLVAISVEIRPPDATYAVRGQVLHATYRFDLSIADLELVVYGLADLVASLSATVAKHKKKGDVFEYLDRKGLEEAKDTLRRVKDFSDAIHKTPVASVEVLPAT
jgi:hypothetical protein